MRKRKLVQGPGQRGKEMPGTIESEDEVEVGDESIEDEAELANLLQFLKWHPRGTAGLPRYTSRGTSGYI